MNNLTLTSIFFDYLILCDIYHISSNVKLIVYLGLFDYFWYPFWWLCLTSNKYIIATVKVTPFLVANLFVSSTEVVQQIQLRPMWWLVRGWCGWEEEVGWSWYYGWQLKDFLEFSPRSLGFHHPNWRAFFWNWVETTNSDMFVFEN